MTVDYAAIAVEAGAAIAEAGMAATIIEQGPKTGPEYNPTIGPDVPHACTVLQTGLSKLSKGGTLVEGAQAAFMMAADGVTISPGTAHSLDVGGVIYRILKVDPFAPAGVVIYYTLQVAI